MALLRNPRVTTLSALVALVLAIVGCGEADDAAESTTAQTGLADVDVRLEDGGFADSMPSTIRVPGQSLILVNVSAGSGGPFRLSVLSRSTAQTFKLKSHESLKLTLDELKPGETAKLIAGKQTLKIGLDN